MTTRITGGEFRGRRIRSTRDRNLRPTADKVRGAIFSIIGEDAVLEARVLDLYAGTGILGIEALSRGAVSADFVEQHAGRCRELRENISGLGLEDCTQVYRGRVETVLARLNGPYDLVFADPPYDLDVWDGLMVLLGEDDRIAEKGRVVAEHRRTTELAKVYGKLVQLTNRRYGDTSVSIFRAGAAD
jgi:16S rRNA (guanine966-N2)-methyltransferase